MVSIPLVRGFDAGAAFAYRSGRRLSVEQFLSDVSRLSVSLPEQPYVLNLCTDRYRFTVGFAAALLRRQVNLLPPNETPDLIERLASHYPGVYCLCDRTTGLESLETVLFPELGDPAMAAVPVPEVPETQVAAIVFTSGFHRRAGTVPKPGATWSRVALAEVEILDLPRTVRHGVARTVPARMLGLKPPC